MRRVLAGLAIATAMVVPARAGQMAMTFEAFGAVQVYGSSGASQRLAIVLADDTVDAQARQIMGERIAASGALAAIVDTPRYIAAMADHPEECAYHSWEFEKLSKYVQKTLKLPRYQPPLLAGLGAGGALAYTTAAEAPLGTFAGIYSAGMCLAFTMSKALCANEDDSWSRTQRPNEARLEPDPDDIGPWTVQPSRAPEPCQIEVTQDFVAKMRNVRRAPPLAAEWGTPEWSGRVGADIAGALAALPAMAPIDDSIADLPLEIEPARTGRPAKTFAVIVTGDGGWAGIDREIAGILAASGVNVVGFNSLQFFWHKRTPEETSQALARVIAHFAGRWNADGVVLVGYSFGADVLPFAVRRLAEDDRRFIRGVALLGPGLAADFEFKVGDWLGLEAAPDALPIVPEINALAPLRVLCVTGKEEDEDGLTACPRLAKGRATLLQTSGGHHFDGDYDRIAKSILLMIPSTSR